MKSQQFQFTQYTPAEFEQFRNAVQTDGFSITQNTIDTVSGHIGSLTYLTGSYNRNQQLLTVTIKTSPWQTFQDSDVMGNVTRVVGRASTTTTPVNPTPVKSPVPATGTGQTIAPKTVVVPGSKAEPPKPAVLPSAGGSATPKPTPKTAAEVAAEVEALKAAKAPVASTPSK